MGRFKISARPKQVSTATKSLSEVGDGDAGDAANQPTSPLGARNKNRFHQNMVPNELILARRLSRSIPTAKPETLSETEKPRHLTLPISA